MVHYCVENRLNYYANKDVMVPNRDNLAALAMEQTGLSDFGETWFFDNIDVLIPSLNSQAQLSDAGVYGAQTMIVSGLVNRLRHKELIKRNPEIMDEQVNVKAVLTGLPRTGSTMLHRMLAACLLYTSPSPRDS